jgi:hypothetical protein
MAIQVTFVLSKNLFPLFATAEPPVKTLKQRQMKGKKAVNIKRKRKEIIQNKNNQKEK